MPSLRAYHLPGRWGLASVSPFCLKLDTFFRMTGIEHESITAATPFGEAPGMTDATVYSLLANIAFVPFVSPMKNVIVSYANLAAWLERFRDRYYPESSSSLTCEA